mgnify:CR=1 FL=1
MSFLVFLFLRNRSTIKEKEIILWGVYMQITYLGIKNFKSIRELEIFDIESALILVGKNNTGKTVVLDAIRAVTEDFVVTERHFNEKKQNIEIVKIICKELGKPESLITHVGDRKGHDMRYAIDPTKIHNELGWLPETKFEDGIKKTIQWYLDNREWWETIISGEYQNYYEKMYSNR